MAPFNQQFIQPQTSDTKMRCPQSPGEFHKKVIKLVPKPLNPILPKIEVKAEYNTQTKFLSADEKQKTSFTMS